MVSEDRLAERGADALPEAEGEGDLARALKYASRRVKWQPACACFKPLKVRYP